MLKDNVEIIGRTVYFSDRDAKRIAKASGLKSKKSRKIKKRLKVVIEAALNHYIDNADELVKDFKNEGMD